MTEPVTEECEEVRKLRNALEAATDTRERIRQFSHAIRSPLGNIKSGMELLNLGDEDLKAYAMEMIPRQVDQALALLDLLREFENPARVQG